MKGAFITNRYYTDAGTKYAFESLRRALERRFEALELLTPLCVFNQPKFCDDYAFVVFWDKDVFLASALERSGVRVFNNPFALEICDDKMKTYNALDGVSFPKTISAPLMYDVCEQTDDEFLRFVEREIEYPIVVKANTGSQGRQVFLAKSRDSLREYYQKLKHIPHHYQEFVGEFGCDIRIYTVGGAAVAACKRQGTDFKSNLAEGGKIALFDAPAAFVEAAEDIAWRLKLDFGAVDFLAAGTPIFLEVNSNAYFRGIEGLGANIAEKIAAYIFNEVV